MTIEPGERVVRPRLLRRPLRPATSSTLVTLLTVMVAVDYADRSALGAVAPDLQDDLSLSTTQLGLLGGSFGLVGGVATLGAGVLVDRVPRLRLLGLSALLWSLAMLATGTAQGFVWLLLARGALAVVLATVGPAYPSLIGDTVAPGKRSVALGRIATGQLVGGALGIGVGALCVALLSWREAFLLLALPALVLAYRLLTTAEPARRGDDADRAVPWRRVLGVLLRTPTAVAVLLSASVGSYYLAGASAFSVLFAVAQYDVSTPVADLALLALGIGAVVGIVLGSRLSDRLADQGRGRERLTHAGTAYVVTALAWLPALFASSLAIALPFLLLGSAALAATLPVLDAVRIDVVLPGLRGRAEAVRTVLRALVEGAAPVVFGLITDGVGDDARGLQRSFLLALPSLVVAAGLLRRAARTFDADRARVVHTDDA